MPSAHLMRKDGAVGLGAKVHIEVGVERHAALLSVHIHLQPGAQFLHRHTPMFIFKVSAVIVSSLRT